MTQIKNNCLDKNKLHGTSVTHIQFFLYKLEAIYFIKPYKLLTFDQKVDIIYYPVVYFNHYFIAVTKFRSCL